MVDEECDVEESYNNDLIKKYSRHQDIIKFVQKYFKRLSKDGASKIIKFILEKRATISIDNLSEGKAFYQYNMSKFNQDKTLKPEMIIYLESELHRQLNFMNKEIPRYEKEMHTNIKTIEGEKTFIVSKDTLYEKFINFVYKEEGELIFKYDFTNPDLELSTPQDTQLPQRCKVQILEDGESFGYPVNYTYYCPECGNITEKNPDEVGSTHQRIQCPNFVPGAARMKRCGQSLYPHKERSLTTNAYYFKIGFKDEEGKDVIAKGISFFYIRPMYYEVIMYKVSNAFDKNLYQIVDVKIVENKTLQIPEKIKENYLFTLQKKFDEYIKEQTGMEIYGLLPIKVAMVIQTVMQRLNMRLIGNIQMVGDASTGKTLVLKYYGYLLNNFMNKMTNGLSVSVPSLRGSRTTITLFNKQIQSVTKGLLGQCYSIHIDEAGENKELIQNLKVFLMEDSYGYSKHEGHEITHKRTAHVNVSENVNNEHIGQYRGAIRKAYKDVITISNDDKQPWDESWDLHKPIYMYNDPYLYKVVKEKRIEYSLKKIFWIDGYDYALHERFPFYFYIVNEKKDEKLKQVISENSAREQIFDTNEMITILKSDTLEEFFESLKEYSRMKDKPEALLKAEEIFTEYGLELDSRLRNFWYSILRVSRIINKRKEIIEEDYNLLRWLIEKTNCKIDFMETTDYKINGAPDWFKEKMKQTKIDNAKIGNEVFGLPSDEFE